MDISQLDNETIDFLSMEYGLFLKELSGPTQKERKKCRKSIEKELHVLEDLEHDCVHKILEADDETFFALLKNCYEAVRARTEERNRKFEIFSADFGEDVKKAFETLFCSDEFCQSVTVKNGCLTFHAEEGDCFFRSLILTDAEGLPDGWSEIRLCYNGEIRKQNGKYILPVEMAAHDYEIFSSAQLLFEKAEVRTEVTRADSAGFHSSPWEYLIDIARAITEKSRFDPCLLNESEKAVLPLCFELTKLVEYTADDSEACSADGFPILKEYFGKHSLHKGVKLLDKLSKLETNNQNIRKQIILSGKLLSFLNLKENEPLWRELYEKLSASQSGYPTTAELYCDEQKLRNLREKIQRLMNAYGYTGTYPDFEKREPLKGVHLTESYGMTYFVTAEKNTVYRIHCYEDYGGAELTIRFLYGTAFLKEREEVTDINSLMFNAKGKRRFGTVYYHTESLNDKDGVLKGMVGISVKKAEMKKLTKEETALTKGFGYSPWRQFLMCLLFMGGLFGIFITIGMMIFGAVMCLVDGQPDEILPLLTDFRIWGFTLVAGWVGFGGAMGIITVLAEKRK